jgi:hypothetical protein
MTTPKRIKAPNPHHNPNPNPHPNPNPNPNKGPGLQTAQSTKDGCWDAYFEKPVDLANAACPCGQNVGCMPSIQPAATVVHEMNDIAAQILAGNVPHFQLHAGKARL